MQLTTFNFIALRALYYNFASKIVKRERKSVSLEKMASRGRGRGFTPRGRGGRGGRNFYQQYDQGPPEFVVGAYSGDESSWIFGCHLSL